MGTITVVQKIEMILNQEMMDILDAQCRIANKLRNMLVDLILKSMENNDIYHYTDAYSLRDEIISIKEKHPYMYSVFSSPLKNLAFQERDALKKYLKDKKAGKPKYHSYIKEGCSLLYDEPNKGIKLKNKKVKISLGSVLDEEGKSKRLRLNVKLAERLRNYIEIKNYRIKKEFDKYYLIVTMDVENKPSPLTGKCIALDFNHKNFFVGMDNEGISYEMSNLTIQRYFNDEIAKVQKKQSRCKHEKITRDDGSFYYEDSKRYKYLEKVIKNLYNKRKVQVEQALYTIADWLVDNYDVIVVGDYRPSKASAPKKGMRKKVLNESCIGKMRTILEQVCERKGKKYIKIDERGTTKTCCICKYQEHKDPKIREFTCKMCNKSIYRDINSAINIGIKGKILSSSDYVDLDLSKPMYAVNYDWRKQTLCLSSYSL